MAFRTFCFWSHPAYEVVRNQKGEQPSNNETEIHQDGPLHEPTRQSNDQEWDRKEILKPRLAARWVLSLCIDLNLAGHPTVWALLSKGDHLLALRATNMRIGVNGSANRTPNVSVVDSTLAKRRRHATSHCDVANQAPGLIHWRRQRDRVAM